MKDLLHSNNSKKNFIIIVNFKHMTGCFTLRQAPNSYLIVNVLK